MFSLFKDKKIEKIAAAIDKEFESILKLAIHLVLYKKVYMKQSQLNIARTHKPAVTFYNQLLALFITTYSKS